MKKMGVLLLGLSCVFTSYFFYFKLSADRPGPEEIFRHMEVIRELKTDPGFVSLKEKQKKEEGAPAVRSEKDKLTQTEAYLVNYFNLKEIPKESDYAQLIEDLLRGRDYLKSNEKFYFGYMRDFLKNDQIQSYVNMFEAMRKNELPGYYAFYHAHSANTGLLQDILTEVRQWLELKVGKKIQLRFGDIVPEDLTPMDTFLSFWGSIFFAQYHQTMGAWEWVYDKFQGLLPFEKIKDLKADWQYKVKNWGGGGTYWIDHIEPLRSQVLSVNHSPFGNSGVDGECSLNFFISGTSISDPRWIIEKVVFEPLKLDKSYIKKITEIYRKYMVPKFGGHMLQILIPKEEVDKLVYLSGRFGTIFYEELLYPSDSALEELRRGKIPENQKFTVLEGFDQYKRRNKVSEYLDKYTTLPFYLVTKKNVWEGVGSDQFGSPSKADIKKQQKIVDLDSLKEWAGITMNQVQSRIVFMPRFFDPASRVKINRYNFVEPDKKKKYRQEIKKVVKQMMSEWVKCIPCLRFEGPIKNKPLLKLFGFIERGQAERERFVKEAAKKN